VSSWRAKLVFSVSKNDSIFIESRLPCDRARFHWIWEIRQDRKREFLHSQPAQRQFDLVNSTAELDKHHAHFQDRGGCIGLTVPIDMPQRFKKALIMNTGFITGDIPLGKGFMMWREFVKANPDFNVGDLLWRSTPILTQREAEAYELPYENERQKGGARIFPLLVCDTPDAEGAELSRRAREWWKKEWTGTSFMVVGAKDPVIGVPGMSILRPWIKHCPEPLVLNEAGHFVQEWADEFMPQALQALASGKAKL